jgi:CheY-like chemotaxis protein
MHGDRTSNLLLYVVAGMVALAVLAADLATPLGVVPWVFYVAPVVATVFGTSAAAPLVAAAASSVLVVVGFLGASSAEVTTALAMTNRSFAVATVWIVAFTVRTAVDRKVLFARQSWIRTVHGRVAAKLQGEQSPDELCRNVVSVLADALGAPVGSVHVTLPDGSLERVASFALPAGVGRARLAPGESLVGQAALERRVLRVRDVPKGYVDVTSGTGGREPRELVVLPASIEGQVKAVVELGLLRPASADDLEVLELVGGTLAIAVQSAQFREQLHELLEHRQRQAEQLRVANEELEQQAEELKASQASLETQQAELEQTNAQLEIQATELARQRDALERSQGEIAAKAAELERASRYKSEFLANMSHELRTPLNSTLILAKLLADNPQGTLTEEQVRYARTISSAGNDLLTLINDVLDLAKIEAGRLDLRAETFPVRRLVEALARTFDPLAREKGLAFDQAIAPGTPEVLHTDFQRLQQVLQNLLSNALKFTERGRVELRVEPGEEGKVAFAVRDTGIGIPPDRQAVIFEPFRQADGSTTRKYGGTGLGLSISRDLATFLGGKLSVESAPEKGSTFTLEIPVRAAAGTPASPPAHLAAARATPPRPAPASRAGDGVPPPVAPRPPPTAGERRVLVVEDDPDFAEILCGVGRDLGFGCRIESTADGGFRAATEEAPHAILLDVGLPDHSGLSLLDRLKQTPETRHIPVHVVSATDEQQPALEMGAVGYAVKPVSREDLVGVYRRLEEKLTTRIRRVLVVEDDDVERDSIGKLLAGDGVEVVGAGTAQEALERLRGETFDCVVMDLALPDATGYDLLDRIDAEQRVLPPVVVYTGRSLTADEEQRLRRRVPSIVVKGARSPERLLDEVTLFLHRVEADLSPERRRMLARSREAAFEDRTVLLVEDDARNVFALASILEPRGARVEIARNGREALDALARNPDVDLVLMDVMMPEMDGYEAMRRIRAQPRLAKLPIIAVTARAMYDDQEAALAAGANDYIAKPLDPDKLLSLVRVWLPR